MAKKPEPAPPAGERLQKVLAQAGHGSRREIETWISAGRVAINGRPAQLGARVGPNDKVTIDHKPVKLPIAAVRPARVLALHKPLATICSRRDPEGRSTVFSLLPGLVDERWIAVGRLDVNTTGLLLFTDDGELAHRLMHPRHQVEREYLVRVFGEVDDDVVQRLRDGVRIDGERVAFDHLERHDGAGSNQWYRCALHSGRNREVRRLWESQGVQVSRLIRIRFGNIVLPRELAPGAYVELAGAPLANLMRLVGMKPPRVRAAD